MAYGNPTPEQIKRWRRYLAEEQMERQTYLNLAARRSGDEAAILTGLADAEQRHIEHWTALLGEHAHPAPRPTLYSRVLSRLAYIFGSIFVLALAQRSEQRQTYDVDEDATEAMAADEHIHGEVVRGLAARSRARFAGTFRAAVFGANDGLVSNLALILGIAATGVENSFVIATGMAGLLAGALSMAAGEFISVASQRELLEASDPAVDAPAQVAKLNLQQNELELVFRARGDSEEESKEHASLLLAAINRPSSELTTSSILTTKSLLSSKERHVDLGDTHAEIGHPWQAAGSSFCFFALGAVVPLLPFLFGMSGTPGVIVSALVVGLVLMFTGGVVGVLSGKAPLKRAIRQLLIGYGAAAVTYTLGLLFGASGI
ncbi:MAG: VIT1/CCC1 transporter family protein [Actinomycetaceae bacterium]|nr:VIT1/CCC1 transporter family protein [Actinomycetaceae bacterium]